MIVRKVMLLGEMAVGKTSIANRLAFDRFGESYKSTIGTDIYVYDVEAPPGDKPFRFLIWDTDGSFEDAMFRSHYMRGDHRRRSHASQDAREPAPPGPEVLRGASGPVFLGRAQQERSPRRDSRGRRLGSRGAAPAFLPRHRD